MVKQNNKIPKCICRKKCFYLLGTVLSLLAAGKGQHHNSIIVGKENERHVLWYQKRPLGSNWKEYDQKFTSIFNMYTDDY